MPKYSYTHLEVMCLESRNYPIAAMRDAVDYLKTIPGADEEGAFVGLVAETRVPAGRFKLLARPMVTLAEIRGKTPRQVWDLFDRDVDKQRDTLARRG